jgi:hypothetical protein
MSSMTEDSSEGQREVSGTQEKSDETERNNRHIDSPKCILKVEVDKDGRVRVTGLQGPCAGIFEGLPPIRQEYWKRRMTAKLRSEIEKDKESDEGK